MYQLEQSEMTGVRPRTGSGGWVEWRAVAFQDTPGLAENQIISPNGSEIEVHGSGKVPKTARVGCSVPVLCAMSRGIP